MKKPFVKKLTHALLIPLAIIIVLWEQLVYRPINWVSRYLEKNKIIHRLADKVRNSNPYVALFILACCGLPLIPFKIAGLYLVGHGYTLLGLGTFGLAKIVGGAISVQIFNLTEPAIRKIAFLNTSLNWIFDKKNKIKKVLTEMPAMVAVKEHTKQMKLWVKNVVVNNTLYQKVRNMFGKKPSGVSVSATVVVESVAITQTEELTIFQRIKLRHKKYAKEYRVE